MGYTYDRYDRLTEKSYDGSAAFRYKYDARGALFEHEDLLNGVTTRYDYDLINRLTGMRTSRGQELSVQYDDKNRIAFNLSKVLGVSTKTQYVYGDTSLKQKPGLIYGVKIDDSQILSYGYDDLSRLSTRTLNTTTPFVTRYEYLDGALPNSTTTLVKSLQVGNDTYAYTYDEVGNITEIKKNGTRINRYEYDELGQLTLAFDYVTLWGEGYAYDTGGNLRRKDYYDLIMGNETQVVEQVIYSYDDPNWKDKLTSYDGQDITYDAIGNPLTYRDGMSFTWQHGRELAGFTKAGTTANYRYNDSGIRTKKVVNGVTTEYYLNGSMILTQITGNDRLDFLYDDARSLLGLKWNGTAYYYVKNLQGDIIGILDSNGNQVVEYVYESWGQFAVSYGSMAATLGELNPFRYRGYYYDTESGLYYLNSRYYDPEIGRFINADGYVDTGVGIHSQNMFAYCINDPVSLSDFSGTFPGYHYATLFGAQRAYEIYISKHPDAADYIVKYHMEGEDYGYYEGHPYSATWVYELIGPWTLPNNPPVPEGAPPSAGKYDLGGGITARIDPARYEGGKRHIHVQYQGKKYAQNDDGSTSHKSDDPPNSVKKVLKKKLNWDWDGKNSNIMMEYIIWTLVFCQGEGCMLWGQKICL